MQANHPRVCMNNRVVSITHLKVSHGDLISFQENYVRTCGEEIKRSFYIDISVGKIISKFLPVRMWRRISVARHDLVILMPSLSRWGVGASCLGLGRRQIATLANSVSLLSIYFQPRVR